MDIATKTTGRVIPWNITDQTRDVVTAWIATAHLKAEQFLFPSRLSESPHPSTRQYSRIVGSWVGSIGLDPAMATVGAIDRGRRRLRAKRRALMTPIPARCAPCFVKSSDAGVGCYENAATRQWLAAAGLISSCRSTSGCPGCLRRRRAWSPRCRWQSCPSACRRRPPSRSCRTAPDTWRFRPHRLSTIGSSHRR
jgi:hypothetical protein